MRAVTAATNAQLTTVPTLTYNLPTLDLRATPPLARGFADRTVRGEAVAIALTARAREGWAPDVIAGHPGWGEMLVLRDVFARAHIIALAEFYYASHGADVGVDPEFPAIEAGAAYALRARNAAMLSALVDADVVVSPTQWQVSRSRLSSGPR